MVYTGLIFFSRQIFTKFVKQQSGSSNQWGTAYLKGESMERATELEYLTWFRVSADFGPADSDVIDAMNEDFMNETGKNLPEGWNIGQDGETVIDR
jgi:hypothetical protein